VGKPKDDREHHLTEEWLISPIAGDCKAYAITKRHELLARGWPSRALLLSEVVVHHLILIVRTKDVDLVLDNLQEAVQPLGARAEYRWVRIESPQNPKYWTTVQIYRVEETASAMAASGRGGDDGVEGRQAHIDRPIEHAPVSRSAALEIDTAPELRTGRSAEYRLEPVGFDRSEVKERAKLEERAGIALSDIIR
jgi:Bacterial transglutaminase-like cysteine proteinase BTLCP